ncbi:MAG: type III pantothenate kinase [Candidatus Humimicrobiaceae bacterium]
MLLAIDIGNIHTAIGLFDGDDISATWRMGTPRYRYETTDEIGSILSVISPFFFSMDSTLYLNRGLRPSALIWAGDVQKTTLSKASIRDKYI